MNQGKAETGKQMIENRPEVKVVCGRGRQALVKSLPGTQYAAAAALRCPQKQFSRKAQVLYGCAATQPSSPRYCVAYTS